MKSSLRFKLSMAGICLAVFVGAFFSGLALHSYFFDSSGKRFGNSEEYDLLILNDPKKQLDETTAEVMEEPETEPEAKPEEPEPAEEELVAEEEPEAEESGESEQAQEVVLENRSSAGEAPPAIDNSASEFREDVLSRERFVVDIPDSASPAQDNVTTSEQASNSTSGASSPVAEIPAPPAETPEPPELPVDIPSPDSPGGTNIVEANLNLGESLPSAGVGVGLDENGLQVGVSLDLVSDGQSEPDGNLLGLAIGGSRAGSETGARSEALVDLSIGGGGEDTRVIFDSDSGSGSEPLLSVSVGGGEESATQDIPVQETAAAEPQVVSNPQPAANPNRNGRVVVGQNMYDNALAGSVSGLIGGLGAPSSSERVQYRPNTPAFETSQPAINATVDLPNNAIASVTQTANAAVSGVTANAGVQQIARTLPIVNTGGNGAITATVPTGLVDASVGGGNGVQLNVNANKLNLPTTNLLPNQVGVNAGGLLNIRVNLGGR